MFYCTALLLLAATADVFGHSVEHVSNVGIIGGAPVPISEVPFMAALRLNRNYHWCGASIIHEQFVLTAAHCIVPNRNYTVAVGTDNIAKGDLYDVKKIIPHPRYSNRTHDYDICLMKLSEEIKFGPNVSKIQLVDKNIKIRTGMVFNATGWGFTAPGGNVSSELRQVSVPFVKRRQCQLYYGIKNHITMRMLCAGEQGKDTCTADSGGPLVWNNVQVGVTSFGARCGDAPAIYTKISVLEPWIRHTINRNI